MDFFRKCIIYLRPSLFSPSSMSSICPLCPPHPPQQVGGEGGGTRYITKVCLFVCACWCPAVSQTPNGPLYLISPICYQDRYCLHRGGRSLFLPLSLCHSQFVSPPSVLHTDGLHRCATESRSRVPTAEAFVRTWSEWHHSFSCNRWCWGARSTLAVLSRQILNSFRCDFILISHPAPLNSAFTI